MPGPVRATLSKVPEITAAFWITKVLTTGMGESTSDYLVLTLGPAIAIGIGAVVFAAALILQFRANRYIAGVYWFAVVMVSVFGTMAADVLHVGLGIPYLFSTIFFAAALAVISVILENSETVPVARTRCPSATGVVQLPQKMNIPSDVAGSASASASSSCKKKPCSLVAPWKLAVTTPSTETVAPGIGVAAPLP